MFYSSFISVLFLTSNGYLFIFFGVRGARDCQLQPYATSYISIPIPSCEGWSKGGAPPPPPPPMALGQSTVNLAMPNAIGSEHCQSLLDQHSNKDLIRRHSEFKLQTVILECGRNEVAAIHSISLSEKIHICEFISYRISHASPLCHLNKKIPESAYGANSIKVQPAKLKHTSRPTPMTPTAVNNESPSSFCSIIGSGHCRNKTRQQNPAKAVRRWGKQKAPDCETGEPCH